MDNTIFIEGVIGVDTTLLSVIRQFNSLKNPTEVRVHINSVGGSVTVGQNIYSYLRGLNIPVTTIASKAYSIACSIFMAGDIRLVERVDNPLMIHFPLVQNLTANSEVLDLVSAELKEIEKEFVKFYGTYLNIPESTIIALMKADTFITADDAVSIGFATGILEPQLKAVAFFDEENEDNKLQTKTFRMKLEKLMDAVAKKLGVSAEATEVIETVETAETPELVALAVQVGDGTEINFPDIKEASEIVVGVRGQVDGVDAEGKFVTVEGDTWVFVAGILEEIIPKETEEVIEEEDDFDMEAFLEMIMGKVEARLQKENSELKAELVAVKKLLGNSEPDLSPTETKSNKPKNKNFFL